MKYSARRVGLIVQGLSGYLRVDPGISICGRQRLLDASTATAACRTPFGDQTSRYGLILISISIRRSCASLVGSGAVLRRPKTQE